MDGGVMGWGEMDGGEMDEVNVVWGDMGGDEMDGEELDTGDIDGTKTIGATLGVDIFLIIFITFP